MQTAGNTLSDIQLLISQSTVHAHRCKVPHMQGVSFSTNNEGASIRKKFTGANIVITKTFETVEGILHQSRSMVQVPYFHTTLYHHQFMALVKYRVHHTNTGTPRLLISVTTHAGYSVFRHLCNTHAQVQAKPHT